MALKTLRPRLSAKRVEKAAIGTHVPKSRWGLGRGGRPWRRKRLLVFERDGYTCQTCGRACMAPECDHKVPLSQGGTDDLDNLATICPPCHRQKTHEESLAGKEKAQSATDC